MANCPKCGAPIPADSQFCVNCGFKLGQTNPAAGSANDAINDAVKGAANAFKKLNNTKDYTAQIDPKDAADNQIMGILAYIPFLFLVPLFAAPNSKFAQFHANQGILSTLVFLGLGVVNTVIDLIIGGIFGIIGIGFLSVLGGIFCWLLGIASTAAFVFLAVTGIINVCNKQAKDLPLVGAFRILK